MKKPDEQFHALKIAKKEELTKNVFLLELNIPTGLKNNFRYQAGQYVTFKYTVADRWVFHDYSMVSAPYEDSLVFAIKINTDASDAQTLFTDYKVGDLLEISEPKGRFTINSKPDEFRTILGFAAGIGITPIISHFKALLHAEPRTRLFLFYGNTTVENVVFQEDLQKLEKSYPNRLQVHYFYSKESHPNQLFQGRLDEHKVKLIINQILNYDDTDEESTIWDAVDEVLICGKGEMIKSIANACYNHGIPKRNIHFELFESYNEDIYPQEKAFPLVEDIEVQFKLYGENYTTLLKNNRYKLLQQLLEQKFPVPYSCKSGICGICECRLIAGDVELLENEYLTDREEAEGRILACQAVAMSPKIKIDFDTL